MSGVQRIPTDREVRLQEIYGTPFPDPVDLLVELVTARSGAGAVAISDRDLTQRLRLKTTDDALRLVALAVKAGRVAVDHDGNRRLLAIPWGDQAPVAQSAPPVTAKAPPSVAPVTAKATTVATPAGRRQQAGKVVHIRLPDDIHAEVTAQAADLRIPLAQIVAEAACAGLRAPAWPAPAVPPVARPTSKPALDDLSDLRVPIALFRASKVAGVPLRTLTEDIIALGWASYQQAQAGKVGQ